MTIAQEEIFGPVLSTISFGDAEEAVKIGNDTIYGLAAAVWTSDIKKAHRAAKALRAGVVWVNCFDAGDMTTPFGLQAVRLRPRQVAARDGDIHRAEDALGRERKTPR